MAESNKDQPKEIQRILNKARHYGMEANFDDSVEDGFTRLVLSGDRIDLFQREGQKWAPNVRIQGTAGPGKLAFLWSNARVREPKPLPTKPANSLPDDDVLAMVPQSQILTEGQLKETIKRINQGIEDAYPGVSITHELYGKGKLDLVLLVIDALYAVSTRNLNTYMSVVVAGLLTHLQADGDLPDTILLPRGPIAIARAG